MSHPLRTLYVNRQNTLRVKPVTLMLGEAVKLQIDWNAYIGANSATISTSTWVSENSNVALSGAANASGITSVTATAASEGCAMLKNTVVLSNGETLVRKYDVKVIDPETSEPTDYRE